VCQAEVLGGCFGGKFILPMAGKQMSDDGCGQAFNELRFFIAAGWLEGMDLSL
jgi:hypothetical protein